MVFDSGIFERGGQAQLAQQNRLFDILNGTIQNHTSRIEQMKASAMKPENILKKKLMGGELTPEESATFNAYQTLEASKMAIDPTTGQMYPRFAPIDIGGGLPAASAMAGMDMPTPQPQQSSFGAINSMAGGNVDDYVPPLDETALMGGMPMKAPAPMPAPSTGLGMLPVGDNYADIRNQPIMRADGSTLPAPANPKQAQERYAAELDIAKAGEIVKQEKQANIDIDVQKKQAMDSADAIKAMPIIENMLENNRKSPDMPYAEKGQIGLRVGSLLTGSKATKEKETAIDLLRQDRLTLAIPLAKALGVNPTDKDFQASLDSVVDLNASKESREAQIKNLMNKMKNKTLTKDEFYSMGKVGQPSAPIKVNSIQEVESMPSGTKFILNGRIGRVE